MSLKKSKPKHYTKKELAEAKAAGDTAIIHALVGKLMKGEILTIAETEYAANLLASMTPVGSIVRVDLASVPGAQHYIFLTLFLAYYGDLDGQAGVIKFNRDRNFRLVPTRVVSIEEKKEDVIRLREYYTAWAKNFATNKHRDQLLNIVIDEIRKDLVIIDSEFGEGDIDAATHEYKTRGTILLSKYLYLRVKRIFEDLGGVDVTINFNGTSIVITPWSMIHILNRHYAKAGKHYDSEKSFHGDGSLRFFEDPEELKKILELLGNSEDTKLADPQYIPFKLNGVIYAVHTKKLKGTKTPLNRLQTFYPVEDPTERNKIVSEYCEVPVAENLIGYVKHAKPVS
jgi:hypothetical protein